jgi:hypothetical protein
MRRTKKKVNWVTCQTCKFATLTRRRANPVVAICSKQKDVSPVTWMLEPKRELASILRVCGYYEKEEHEKEITRTEE